MPQQLAADGGFRGQIMPGAPASAISAGGRGVHQVGVAEAMRSGGPSEVTPTRPSRPVAREQDGVEVGEGVQPPGADHLFSSPGGVRSQATMQQRQLGQTTPGVSNNK